MGPPGMLVLGALTPRKTAAISEDTQAAMQWGPEAPPQLAVGTNLPAMC